jgi:hypothetical protein
MKEEISLIRVGHSLYLRVPYWFRTMRDLSPGDTVLFMPENVDDDGAVRLKFVKAETAEGAVE